MQLIGKAKPTVVLLAILALAGVVAWIYQLIGGLGVTGMNNGASWGVYTICFMFFVGLSAGGLIVASSASVFHIEKFKVVAVPAVILSTVCICLAAGFVLVDLGGIQRVWRMITGPNFVSPLLWDMVVIVCYLLINVLYLFFMCSAKADPKKVELISRFALPVAILVHSVTAWIFGLQIAREGWHTAILAPIFVASAMDSGLALLILSLFGLDKAGKIEFSKELQVSLAGLLATCIAIDAYLIGCELLTMAYPGTAGANELLAAMLAGPMAPFFWIEVVVGLVAPFLVLVFAKNRAKSKAVAIASACVIIGVFCKRVWLLLTSFLTPNIVGAPGMLSGSSTAAESSGVAMWSMIGSYAPTWVEVVVAVGLVSLGVLVFVALAGRLMSPRATKDTAFVASTCAEVEAKL